MQEEKKTTKPTSVSNVVGYPPSLNILDQNQRTSWLEDDRVRKKQQKEEKN